MMKLIPTGIENFKTLIDKNAYYVDKTEFISEVLNEQVALYTRPRRFGKTLNMSMLYYFFSNKEKENAYLFDGLNITHNSEAMKHQNQYPVILLSLKDMKNLTFDRQLNSFSHIIYRLLEIHLELLESNKLTDVTKRKLKSLHSETASIEDLSTSLQIISQAMFTHYHQKVIILIDEYDVPLQAAYQNDYYDEMVDFLRSVFSSSLKTNDALEKGILTGCLRISKESIFTGLNNFKSYSILYKTRKEFFGFTEKEVQQLLSDYQLSSKMNEVREWYDGYLFGEHEVYNPWSTLMYVSSKIDSPNNKPQSYWANTSGNDIVISYIRNGNNALRQDFEKLMNGESVVKNIKTELTYREMDDINNIYSFLLLTGYLKAINDLGDHQYELVIPNREVYEIYKQSFMSYFTEYTTSRQSALYLAFKEGQTRTVNDILNDILSKSISYYDNKESFYHGFLIGLFHGFNIKSNREAGNGRFDVCIYPGTIFEKVILVECKHSDELRDLVSDANKAASQIIEKNYEEEIRNEGYFDVISYGISFYKKQCFVVKVEHNN